MAGRVLMDSAEVTWWHLAHRQQLGFFLMLQGDLYHHPRPNSDSTRKMHVCREEPVR